MNLETAIDLIRELCRSAPHSANREKNAVMASIAVSEFLATSDHSAHLAICAALQVSPDTLEVARELRWNLEPRTLFCWFTSDAPVSLAAMTVIAKADSKLHLDLYRQTAADARLAQVLCEVEQLTERQQKLFRSYQAMGADGDTTAKEHLNNVRSQGLTALEIAEVLMRRRGIQVEPGEPISAEQLSAVEIPIMGGCQGCGASLAAYNAFPQSDGFWACQSCSHAPFITIQEWLSQGFANDCMYCGCERESSTAPGLCNRCKNQVVNGSEHE